MPPHDVDLLYWKGQLVSYLLDVELRAHGSNLDALMRELYVEFGESDRQYTNADLEAIASRLAGVDLVGFFVRYVEGGEPLQLDGGFQHYPVP